MVYLTVRLPCLRLASIDAFLQPEFGQFFVFLHIPKEKDIFIEDTDIHFLSAKGQEKEKWKVKMRLENQTNTRVWEGSSLCPETTSENALQ
jgi:hypothetical protein